MDNDVG